MELEIEETLDAWKIKVVMFIREPNDLLSTFRMSGETVVPKAQCPTPEAKLAAVQGAVSIMVNKMISPWRLPLVARIRDAVMTATAPHTPADGGPRTATGDGATTCIAQGVLPLYPED